MHERQQRSFRTPCSSYQPRSGHCFHVLNPRDVEVNTGAKPILTDAANAWPLLRYAAVIKSQTGISRHALDAKLAETDVSVSHSRPFYEAVYMSNNGRISAVHLPVSACGYPYKIDMQLTPKFYPNALLCNQPNQLHSYPPCIQGELELHCKRFSHISRYVYALPVGYFTNVAQDA
jgi:hypothetical protein